MAHAIYIWQATGKHADNNLRAHAPAGHILVKFGKTSTHLGDERLLKVARCYGFGVRIIHNSEAVDVYEVERKLLKLGEQAVGIHGKSGWTEFRYVSPADLVRARALVTTASAPEVLAEAREQSSAAQARYAYEQIESHRKEQESADYDSKVREQWTPVIAAARLRVTTAQNRLDAIAPLLTKGHRALIGSNGEVYSPLCVAYTRTQDEVAEATESLSDLQALWARARIQRSDNEPVLPVVTAAAPYVAPTDDELLALVENEQRVAQQTWWLICTGAVLSMLCCPLIWWVMMRGMDVVYDWLSPTTINGWSILAVFGLILVVTGLWMHLCGRLMSAAAAAYWRLRTT